MPPETAPARAPTLQPESVQAPSPRPASAHPAPASPARFRFAPAARFRRRPRRARRVTLRQFDFCANYVASGNAADAARKAGYSARCAHNQGYRLLQLARVQAQIRALQTEIAESVDPGMVLGRLDELCGMAESKGDYRSAARILETMSRLVGLDLRGAAAHLRAPTPGEVAPPEPAK
jgi:hypothetical protein